MRPHRRKPTRLPHPWDSPGRNTGVGCHFLLQRMKVKSESEVTQSSLTLSDPLDCSLPGSSIHGIFQARVLEWGAIAFSGNKLPACNSAAESSNWLLLFYLFWPLFLNTWAILTEPFTSLYLNFLGIYLLLQQSHIITTAGKWVHASQMSAFSGWKGMYSRERAV